MVGNFLNSVFDYIAKQNERNNQHAMIEHEYDLRKKDYNRRLAEAESLFDRNYYRNYMDDVETRHLIDRTQQQLQERTRAMYNSAVVTGDNTSSIGAMHRRNNTAMQQLDAGFGQSQQQQRKQVKEGYDNTKRTLMDYIRDAKNDRTKKHYAVNQSDYNDELSFLRTITNRIGSTIGSGVSQMLFT